MTPQELKNSILQLAIQGKLVEQRAEEGTGAELLEKILAAKNAEGAKGRGRKLTRSRGVRGGGEEGELSKLPEAAKSQHSNTLSALSASPREEIPDDEKPFEIPESWEWVRLGDITSVITKGTTPRGGNVSYSDKGVGFLRAENIAGLDALNKSNLKYIDEETHLGILRRSILEENDILITIAGTLGRTAIVRNNDLPLNANQAVSIIRLVDAKTVNLKYIIIALNSPVVQRLLTKQKKVTAIPNLTLGIIGDCMFPLPPLAEQKRIVAKIEELLPLIDCYEKAWSRLEDFNKRFPVDMQKSLLQMAIQGKLVEQRADEGTGAELLEKILAAKSAEGAKGRGNKLTRSRGVRGGCEEGELFNLPKVVKSHHGKLSALSASPREEIPDDEKPFDIPESWEWVRLGDGAEVQLGKMLDKGKNKGTPYPYLANLSVRWRLFDLSALRMMPFTESECDKFALLPGDVLMCEGGVPGRCAVWREKTSPVKYQKAIHRIRSKIFFPDFIQRYFEAICDSSWFVEMFTGTTIKHLPRETLCNTLIPLPPLAEQKRIVAKLEELLPLCERLK